MRELNSGNPGMSFLHSISGCQNPERQADVIFLHGLGGHPEDTWRPGAKPYDSWPIWLGQDFPGIGVWSLGYAASPSRFGSILSFFGKGSPDAGHSMALPDRAVQVINEMTQAGIGRRPVFFICHSLGGLLAKYILRRSADVLESDPNRAVFEQTRAVLFLATPHAGASLASLADKFRLVFGTTVSVEELRAHDAHLREIYEWYRKHATAQGITTVTYYETRTVNGALLVNPTSAHPGVGEDPVPLDEDHISIVKLVSRETPVYRSAARLVREATQPRRGEELPRVPSTTEMGGARPRGAASSESSRAGRHFGAAEAEAIVLPPVLNEDYLVERVIQDSSLSRSLWAKGPKGRPFVIKEIKKPEAYNPQAIEKIGQIYERAGLLKHVSLPEKTLEAGGKRYEIIRVVEGWTLEQVMQANPATGVFGRLLEDWANQLLELLAPLHREGFVHRDVSPFNVMLTSKDVRLVLIDFSSAAHISEDGGSTIYCPGFTAPEAPRSLAPAADVYSLAALLYYVNTCKLPPSREDVMYREHRMQLTGPVYHRICTFVENATALDPADRPASAELALRAIRRQKTTSVIVSREAGTLHLPDGRVISQHEHFWDVGGR